MRVITPHQLEDHEVMALRVAVSVLNRLPARIYVRVEDDDDEATDFLVDPPERTSIPYPHLALADTRGTLRTLISLHTLPDEIAPPTLRPV